MSTQFLYKLPKSWEWRQLGEVVTLVNGRAYKKDELLNEGPTPVLRVGNFFSNRSWYYSDLELPENKYCNKGDLLYAWSASFGPKIWDGQKAIYHYHIWKIDLSDYIDKYYLFYLLALDSEKIKASGNGIGMMHATKGGMEKRQIPLPPLTEQQKIAEILDAADALRQKDQQLIDHYTALSQSLFLDMFGDTFRNPKNWNIVNVEDVSSDEKYSIKAGPFGSALKKEFYVQSGYKIYGQEQVIKDDLSFGDYYINSEKYKSLESCSIKSGDVLISLVGTYGKISVVPEEYEKGIINPRLMKISPNQLLIRPDFLKTLLQTSGVGIQLKTHSRGGDNGYCKCWYHKKGQNTFTTIRFTKSICRTYRYHRKTKTTSPSQPRTIQ